MADQRGLRDQADPTVNAVLAYLWGLDYAVRALFFSNLRFGTFSYSFAAGGRQQADAR